MIENYQIANAPKPTGAVIGLDIVSTSQRTATAIDEGVYLVSTGSACHFNFGDNTVVATASDGLLMPGERLLFLPNQYIAIIKATGATDSVVRFAACE